MTLKGDSFLRSGCSKAENLSAFSARNDLSYPLRRIPKKPVCSFYSYPNPIITSHFTQQFIMGDNDNGFSRLCKRINPLYHT